MSTAISNPILPEFFVQILPLADSPLRCHRAIGQPGPVTSFPNSNGVPAEMSIESDY